MSTNCSRTSFCDYSAGRTKSVFYTAAVLHRERRRADQIPRYCATEHTSFVLVKIFFWNIINQWIILVSTESISIDFHLDNDTHSMQRRHWMSTETAHKTSVFSWNFSLSKVKVWGLVCYTKTLILHRLYLYQWLINMLSEFCFEGLSFSRQRKCIFDY